MSDIKDTKVYNINDFLNWNDKGDLSISPKYQRNPIWNEKAKSYLIDTIVRGLPIPPIFMRQTIDANTRKTTREIVDGQQRLRAIISFISGDFPILKSHSKEFGGMFYNDLEEDIQIQILEYNIPVEVVKIKDDASIYDMFARLNTNSMTANEQELRNAKYWGEFKVFVYRKAAECRDFFIENSTFRDKDLSRMKDIEFVSSIIMFLNDGIIAESRIIIDKYYEKFDEGFEQANDIEIKFDRLFQILNQIFNSEKFTTSYFHRKNYFFTLICVIIHQMYGIKNFSGRRNDQFSVNNFIDNVDIFINLLMNFESDFQKFMQKEGQIFSSSKIQMLSGFEKHHVTRTTSQAERTERIKILNDFIYAEKE
ncbi:DUF262 domain-containing protein [Arcicella rosea]|uniref:GmrSD restriction endonucleases N-terminal domain-containing protein n=1 Tax=Arcicella rosea TaxID=502909 RepID=A0A841EEM4_9BACT|nr:DUF262 domain-containing protein [Arcicella rosea]MBB6001595.1 hypothetical protein [Arcicella rosea]